MNTNCSIPCGEMVPKKENPESARGTLGGFDGIQIRVRIQGRICERLEAERKTVQATHSPTKI